MSLPASSQPVTVRLPDAEALPARVDESDAAGLTLALVLPLDALHGSARARRGPGPFLADGRCEDVIVEYTTPTGIHRLVGTAERVPGRPSLVRLVNLESPPPIQRRSFVRVDAVLPVVVRRDSEGAEPLHTTTLDLSAVGVRVRDPAGALPVGEPVEVELPLAGHGGLVLARGHVARTDGPSVKGIELDGIAECDRERLVRFVMERERALLLVRREARR